MVCAAENGVPDIRDNAYSSAAVFRGYGVPRLCNTRSTASNNNSSTAGNIHMSAAQVTRVDGQTQVYTISFYPVDRRTRVPIDRGSQQTVLAVHMAGTGSCHAYV
jgi:hypothetical protein